MQRALFVLLNLLKPCFLGVGKSCSLYKHYQAICPFPGQNKQRKKETKEKRRRKNDEEQQRRKRKKERKKLWS